jgi:hypothetical protein
MRGAVSGTRDRSCERCYQRSLECTLDASQRMLVDHEGTFMEEHLLPL